MRGGSRLQEVAPGGYVQTMKAAGVKELRNLLSAYLREVQLGESVLVTHHGRVIAELRPPGQGPAACVPDDQRSLRGAIEEGWIRPPSADLSQGLPRLPRKLFDARSFDESLEELRGEGDE